MKPSVQHYEESRNSIPILILILIPFLNYEWASMSGLAA